MFLAVGIILLLVSAGIVYSVVNNKTPQVRSSAPLPPSQTGFFPTAYVNMETDYGEFVIALSGNETPVTVQHFLELVVSDFYNGTIFHVVVKNQLIEGGGYLTNLSQKIIPVNGTTGQLPSIPLEINPVLKNTRGTVGMVHNATDPNTAVSEFYINLQDNPSLDKNQTSPGFSVFGRVLTGMDVVDSIGNIPTSDQTTPGGATLVNVPNEHIKIRHAVVLGSPG